MCPHEILTVRAIRWKIPMDRNGRNYRDCVADHRIHKRVIPVKELVRLILKSAVETGTPFTFNRDLVNEANPNSHRGIIYCSNLCTEIAQYESGGTDGAAHRNGGRRNGGDSDKARRFSWYVIWPASREDR